MTPFSFTVCVRKWEQSRDLHTRWCYFSWHVLGGFLRNCGFASLWRLVFPWKRKKSPAFLRKTTQKQNQTPPPGRKRGKKRNKTLPPHPQPFVHTKDVKHLNMHISFFRGRRNGKGKSGRKIQWKDIFWRLEKHCTVEWRVIPNQRVEIHSTNKIINSG